MSLFPSFGGARYSPTSQKVIRLLLKGCTNRPFFHISVQELKKEPEDPVIEQIGNYDPLPNSHNEKLVAINYNRLEYWLREGAKVTIPVQKLLGLSGYFPVHPETIRNAWVRRNAIAKELEKLKMEVAEIQEKSNEKASSVESSDTVTSVEESSDPSAELPQDDNSSDKNS